MTVKINLLKDIGPTVFIILFERDTRFVFDERILDYSTRFLSGGRLRGIKKSCSELLVEK